MEKKKISRSQSLRKKSMEATKEALLDAGIELFSQQGLDAPSLDAICEQAGYTRGAFYVHFRNRDDFLVAVMKRIGESFLDLVLGMGDAIPLETIIRVFVDMMDSGEYPLTNQEGVKPHQLLEACARSEAIRNQYLDLIQKTVQRLQNIIEYGQSQAQIRCDISSKQIAYVLLTTVIGAQTLIELNAPFHANDNAEALLILLRPIQQNRSQEDKSKTGKSSKKSKENKIS